MLPDPSLRTLAAEFPGITLTSIPCPDPAVTMLRFLQAQRAFYSRNVADLDAEISTAMADREAMYSPQECDRKTRHINSMIRSRESAEREVAYFDGLIEQVKSNR